MTAYHSSAPVLSSLYTSPSRRSGPIVLKWPRVPTLGPPGCPGTYFGAPGLPWYLLWGLGVAPGTYFGPQKGLWYLRWASRGALVPTSPPGYLVPTLSLGTYFEPYFDPYFVKSNLAKPTLKPTLVQKTYFDHTLTPIFLGF